MGKQLAYFQSPGIELGKALYSNGRDLVKRAIIAIEGCHRCNKGKTYDMPPEYIQELADNTNQEIANGREIPLFRDHQKSAESKFGKLTGLVECRKITSEDLPDPSATGMLGKLAIFANANITSCVDLVNSKAIKPLSPGIDISRKLIFEVSAVPIASMPGVAFFGYKEIKAQKLRYADLRDEAIEALDTLIETMRQSEAKNDGQQVGGDLTYKQASFMSFVEDLQEIFELAVMDADADDAEISYSQNPYDDRVMKGDFGSDYGLDTQEKDAVLGEAAAILSPAKRRASRNNRSEASGRTRGNPAIGGLSNGKGRGG